MARIFLSYDHEDAALARPLAAALEKSGHAVWYDRHIQGGAQYSQKIEKALNDSDAVIVLWSQHSVDSAWVRDEAAEGRDRNKLIPLSVNGTNPPMGFRQFQTIDLGRWQGRGRVPRYADILDAIDCHDVTEDEPEVAPPVRRGMHSAPVEKSKPAWLLSMIAVLLMAGAGFAAWKFFGSSSLPVVEIAAADSTPRSQAMASDLFVKLGSLAQIGEGKWKLVDGKSREGKSDILFRTSATMVDGHPNASVVLLDGADNTLLWSREFGAPGERESAVKQQAALTTGRVLGCALESREDGGLRKDVIKIFLNACANLAEVGWDKANVLASLRQVVAANPKFAAGWSHLLSAESDAVSLDEANAQSNTLAQFTQDIETAKKLDPNLAEVILAELSLVKPPPIKPIKEKIDQALAMNPGHARVLSFRSGFLALVGRVSAAAEDARRAVEADPLSPEQRYAFILALAYAGNVDEAWKELARAKQDFPDAKTIEQAETSLNLRYGDFEKAMAVQLAFPVARPYIEMRRNPSQATVERFETIIPSEGMVVPQLIFGLSAFTEIGRVDKAYELLTKPGAPALPTGQAYFFFRSYMAPFRADPRFMPLMKKLGLVDYWKESDEWPDFCNRADKPYDCRAEAAKLG